MLIQLYGKCPVQCSTVQRSAVQLRALDQPIPVRRYDSRHIVSRYSSVRNGQFRIGWEGGGRWREGGECREGELRVRDVSPCFPGGRDLRAVLWGEGRGHHTWVGREVCNGGQRYNNSCLLCCRFARCIQCYVNKQKKLSCKVTIRLTYWIFIYITCDKLCLKLFVQLTRPWMVVMEHFVLDKYFLLELFWAGKLELGFQGMAIQRRQDHLVPKVLATVTSDLCLLLRVAVVLKAGK